MMNFNFTPDFGAQRQVEPKVNVVKFGDSYENRIRSGIHTKSFTWNLSFANRRKVEGQAILAFLDQCDGVQAFLWTPPDLTVSYTFVCRQWSHTLDKANLYTIQASFERVYEPSV